MKIVNFTKPKGEALVRDEKRKKRVNCFTILVLEPKCSHAGYDKRRHP
jgi:hypothetical protein